MDIKVKHGSEHRGEDWWDIGIWLEGADLAQVDHVVYELDPTFPNPVRTVGDRESNFRLEVPGAGEFSVYAHVNTKDGQDIPIKYDLKLHGRGESWSQFIDDGTTKSFSSKEVTRNYDPDNLGEKILEMLNKSSGTNQLSDQAMSSLIEQVTPLLESQLNSKSLIISRYSQADLDSLDQLRSVINAAETQEQKAALLRENIDEYAGAIIRLVEGYQ